MNGRDWFCRRRVSHFDIFGWMHRLPDSVRRRSPLRGRRSHHIRRGRLRCDLPLSFDGGGGRWRTLYPRPG
jgi:hypothetical protein